MSAFAKASASRLRSLKAILGGVAILGVSAVILSGCAAPDVPAVDAKPGETLELKLGTALPVTGSLAFLGPPEIAGVGLAVQEVNDAHLGVAIEVTYGDSGDTDNKVYETEVPRLLTEGVSAIIGSSSSGTSKQFIDSVVGAGVVQFSPADTSVDFTTWEDNGLYWRTAPSDILRGEVLGTLMAGDGVRNVAIINREDSYGTGVSARAKEVFEEAGGTVVSTQTYEKEDKNYTTQVSATLAANPEAILLVAFDEARQIIPKLAQGGFDLSKLYLAGGDLANLSGDFTSLGVSLEGAHSTTPGLDLDTLGGFKDEVAAFWAASDQNTTGEELTEFSYSPESYDAIVLLALAALLAGSTEGVEIAARLQEVSGGSGDGTKCTEFAECAQLILNGETIDYDGKSGPITFDDGGDATAATMGIVQYDADNTYHRTSE